MPPQNEQRTKKTKQKCSTSFFRSLADGLKPVYRGRESKATGGGGKNDEMSYATQAVFMVKSNVQAKVLTNCHVSSFSSNRFYKSFVSFKSKTKSRP